MSGGILCSRHQAELYADTRGGQPMGRWLCPEPGCTSILADETIVAMRDQGWCDEYGMLAPGWKTLNPGQQP
jgi:hypothetical protein